MSMTGNIVGGGLSAFGKIYGTKLLLSTKNKNGGDKNNNTTNGSGVMSDAEFSESWKRALDAGESPLAKEGREVVNTKLIYDNIPKLSFSTPSLTEYEKNSPFSLKQSNDVTSAVVTSLNLINSFAPAFL